MTFSMGFSEVGQKADLSFLEKSLFDLEPHEIDNAKVLLTMMDGVVRHREGF